MVDYSWISFDISLLDNKKVEASSNVLQGGCNEKLIPQFILPRRENEDWS